MEGSEVGGIEVFVPEMAEGGCGGEGEHEVVANGGDVVLIAALELNLCDFAGTVKVYLFKIVYHL